MVLIASSILSADFSKLGKEILDIEKAGADWLHIDVMDGHFVKNITIGPVVVSKIRKVSKIFFDVHLMIEKPENFIEQFVKAGADLITVHAEACHNLKEVVNKIKNLNCKVGVSINPDTSIDKIKDIIPKLDLVLIMSVNPGFGGQGFMESVLPKIKKARELIDKTGKKIFLEVDGGINDKNAKSVIQNGANVLVAGNYVFTSNDYKKAINSLKKS